MHINNYSSLGKVHKHPLSVETFAMNDLKTVGSCYSKNPFYMYLSHLSCYTVYTLTLSLISPSCSFLSPFYTLLIARSLQLIQLNEFQVESVLCWTGPLGRPCISQCLFDGSIVAIKMGKSTRSRLDVLASLVGLN